MSMPSRTPKGRVVFLITLKPGSTGAFLTAYERIRDDVAGVRGHIVDQVCRLREADDDTWLITSEWQSLECFLEWERSEGHRELAKPLRECIASARSMKFDVIEETRLARPGAVASASYERGVYKWFDAA
jgi:heme oxygenase (mycobilin-producing)